MGIFSWLSRQGNLLEWMTMIGTVGSATIAIIVVFLPKFSKGKFKLSEFRVNKRGDWNVELNNYPPEIFEASDVFFYVEQISGKETKNVNLQITSINELSRKSSNGDNYLLTNLKWDDFDEDKIFKSFATGAVYPCNLGRFLQDIEGNDFLFFNKVDKDKIFLDSYTDAVGCGEFAIEILLSGENVKSLKKKVFLKIDKKLPNSQIGSNDSCIYTKFV